MSAFRHLAVAALSLAIAAPAFAESPTRVRLLSSPNPSKLGQTVKLSAEVDGLGGGAPTGTVSFADGYALLGKGALSPHGAGQATLAAGVRFTCSLTEAGGVACWGVNNYGQLGDGTTTTRIIPAPVSGLPSGVVAVAAGYSHACALTKSGAVKCWGTGSLGNGTTFSLTPVDVQGLSSGVVAITKRCALTSAGAVKCWGGLVGDGTETQRLTPVDVPGLSSGVVAITSGAGHDCVLTSAGAVKCWGVNNHGEVGDGTRRIRHKPVAVSGLDRGVVAVAAGGEDGYRAHTCAVTSAGGVKCWGWNNAGQLGSRTAPDSTVPISVPGLPSGVVAVASGSAHTCAVTSAGAAECWGWSFFVQIGSIPSGVVAITAGYSHSCALFDDGAVKCWGQYGPWSENTWSDDAIPKIVSTGLVRARASFSTSALRSGAHTLRAGFGGDASHAKFIGSVMHAVR
jgi:alpha-tubulin suppressor-like RCC1 family protein